MADEHRQQLAQRFALALGALGVACVALAVVAIALRPPRFTTHRDAIGYALMRHGIEYEEIYINHSWPDTVNSVRFAANLDVRVPGRRPVAGMLACRSGRESCSFSLRDLGITNEQLPDLSPMREQTWLTWIEQTVDRVIGG